MATLSSLRSEVRLTIDRNDVDTHIDSRINWTIRALVVRLRIPDFESTATTTLVLNKTAYDVPSDWLATRTLKIVEQKQFLRPMSPGQEASIDETMTGLPSTYYRYGRSFIIHPAADSEYAGNTLRVRYMSLPPTLSAEDSPSPLPEWLDEVIVLGAAYRMLRDLNETDRATKVLGHLRYALGSAIDVAGYEFAETGGSTSVVSGNVGLL